MKKIVLSAAFLGLSFMCMAQEKVAAMPAQGKSNFNPEQMKENRILKLKEEYNLTDEQVAKVRELNNKREEEQKKLQAYQSSERTRIAKEQEEGMKKILTPEQFQKFLDQKNKFTLKREGSAKTGN